MFIDFFSAGFDNRARVSGLLPPPGNNQPHVYYVKIVGDEGAKDAVSCELNKLINPLANTHFSTKVKYI